MTKNRKKSSPKTASNQLRIIGGQWRGHKLRFADTDGLRPTPDRVRETLFNWLAGVVEGARCLDLFAGSGALALEALSRGACHADLVDNSSDVTRELHQNLQQLDCDNAKVWTSTAAAWLQQYRADHGYDIIFLDPPYHRELLTTCIELIDQQQLLSDNARIYLETASNESLPMLPAHWQLHREKTAGQVRYCLFIVPKTT